MAEQNSELIAVSMAIRTALTLEVGKEAIRLSLTTQPTHARTHRRTLSALLSWCESRTLKYFSVTAHRPEMIRVGTCGCLQYAQRCTGPPPVVFWELLHIVVFTAAVTHVGTNREWLGRTALLQAVASAKHLIVQRANNDHDGASPPTKRAQQRVKSL